MREHAGTDGWEHARGQGIGFLEDGDYAAAVSTLQQAVDGDPGGDSQALLGLAHFQREEYDLAAEHYSAALEQKPDNRDWRDMLRLAEANAVSEIDVPVPDVSSFSRDKLLAPPNFLL